MLISDKLTGEIRRDFTILHPEILRERCVIKPGVLRLDNSETWQEYKVVVMPFVRVIDLASLKKLKEFVDAGGKLIATAPQPYKVAGKLVEMAPLPTKSVEFGKDKEVIETVRSLFGFNPERPPTTEPFTKRTNPAGGAAYFIPSLTGPGLQAALDDALPCADVSFAEPGPKLEGKKGMLSYLHKTHDGRNIYFLSNSSDEPVDMNLTLRGKMELESWNPYEGSMTAVETHTVEKNGQACTRLRLNLDPMKSLFFVEKKN